VLNTYNAMHSVRRVGVSDHKLVVAGEILRESPVRGTSTLQALDGANIVELCHGVEVAPINGIGMAIVQL
jgi:hypothetical protein